MTVQRSHSTLRSGLAVIGIVVLSAFGVTAFPMSASAATQTVTTTADTGAGSLRDAIAAAGNGDTIAFNIPGASPHIISLLSTITIPVGVIIDGSGSPTVVITGGTSAGNYPLFIFLPSVAGESLTVQDVTFDGTATVPDWTGHAIVTSIVGIVVPHDIKLTRVIAQNLVAAEGPVLNIFALDATGNVTIADSDFTNNSTSAGNGGGALYFRGIQGTIAISDTDINNNTSNANGGAIFIDGNGGGVPTLTLDAVSFAGNATNGVLPSGLGGAIYANHLAGLSATGSTFVSNSATVVGGAVAIDALDNSTSTVDILGSRLGDNFARFNAAAIYLGGGQGSLNITASTFALNRMSNDGADAPIGRDITLDGVGSVNVTITQSTIYEQNDAPIATSTYAIFANAFTTGVLTISHSTIVSPGGINIATLGNSASTIDSTILDSVGTGADYLRITTQSAPTDTVATTWSLLSGPSTALLGSTTGSTFSVSSFGLGLPATNGGFTLTMLPTETSPAHNGGNPAFSAPGQFDQRGTGFARVVQTVDIGAVELQTLSLAATGQIINPLLPTGAGVLLLLGVGAVLFSRVRLARQR